MTVATSSVDRWVEVHRLAVVGGEAGIARDVGGRLGRVWLRTSRCGDVVRVAEGTSSLGSDPGAHYDLGWAKGVAGRAAVLLCPPAARGRRPHTETMSTPAAHSLANSGRQQSVLRSRNHSPVVGPQWLLASRRR